MKTHHSIHIDWLGTLGIVALCFCSRLPQLMSPYLHADGDECVLGLMANHIAQGREFPFYFWGQSYGFSWVEAGAVALAIKVFGISILTLKIPMLLLWALGCVFFYRSLSQWTSPIHAFWITCLLIFSPAWMIWSMKARGGYITAFLLSMIALFLMARNWKILPKRTYLYIGLLGGFIYFSQPVFLLGLLPLLLYALGQKKDFKSAVICVLGFAAVFILGMVMAQTQGNTGIWKPIWFRPDHWSFFLSSFRLTFFNALNQEAGGYWASVTASNAWCAVFLLGLGAYIRRSITKKTNILSTLLLVSVVLILSCTYFIDTEIRYLLSLSVFLIFWFGILSFEWQHKNIFSKTFLSLLISIFCILGILVSWDCKNIYGRSPQVPEMQEIPKMVGFLENSGIKYVFSLDDDLSWKLMFFSGEGIISRWAGITGRQPEYYTAVNQAFISGKKVAVVGNMLNELTAYMIIEYEGLPTVVADPYFVYPNPSKKLVIDQLKF